MCCLEDTSLTVHALIAGLFLLSHPKTHLRNHEKQTVEEKNIIRFDPLDENFVSRVS